MCRIENKFDIIEINKTQKEYGIAENYKELTNSQANYILTFKNVERIRKRATEAGIERIGNEGKGTHRRGEEKRSEGKVRETFNFYEKDGNGNRYYNRTHEEAKKHLESKASEPG